MSPTEFARIATLLATAYQAARAAREALDETTPEPVIAAALAAENAAHGAFAQWHKLVSFIADVTTPETIDDLQLQELARYRTLGLRDPQIMAAREALEGWRAGGTRPQSTSALEHCAVAYNALRAAQRARKAD